MFGSWNCVIHCKYTMERRALGIQSSRAPAKPSSSHSRAGNSHPGKSMPGVTFTALNNLFVIVFV